MFQDRRDAGRRLAARLGDLRDRPDVVAVAIPRGGVVVGFEVARALRVPLGIVIPRKIGAPGNPELAIGAVAGDGALVLNDDVTSRLGVDVEYVEDERMRQLAEIRRRRETYLAGRPDVDISGKTAVLIDDGLATGSTALAAVRALRNRAPSKIVLAVPVAPRETLARLGAEVDDLVCLETPAYFSAVGQFYSDFRQTTDEEVVALLAESPPDGGQEESGR